MADTTDSSDESPILTPHDSPSTSPLVLKKSMFATKTIKSPFVPKKSSQPYPEPSNTEYINSTIPKSAIDALNEFMIGALPTQVSSVVYGPKSHTKATFVAPSSF